MSEDKKPIEVPHAYTLNKPIKLLKNGEVTKEITTVTIERWPEFADLVKLEPMGRLAGNRYAIKALTDLPEGAIDKLRTDDFNTLMELIGPFFEAGKDATSAATSED